MELEEFARKMAEIRKERRKETRELRADMGKKCQFLTTKVASLKRVNEDRND